VKRVPIYLKLLLLAGVPVLGALVLASVIARDAQREAKSVAALGSLEDLARLSVQISGLVHDLQLERSALALEMAEKSGARRALGRRFASTNFARRQVSDFFAGQRIAALPERLARDLSAAEKALDGIDAARAQALDPAGKIDQTIDYYTVSSRNLINATAALAQLTDDGQLMRAISALVNVLEVKERASQEHAVLGHVFAISQYPPGMYKFLVSLITEEADYVRVLEVNATDAVSRRFHELRSGADFEQSLVLRTVALDTLDDDFKVDAREWDRVQTKKVLGLRNLEVELLGEVQAAAAAKAVAAKRSVNLSYGLGGGVVLCSALLAWFIARGIASSIRNLAHAAGKVRRDKDFRVRAGKTSEDELGALTDTFNEMLGDIQQRDEELRAHRENLEQLVQQRTLALQQRNEAMRLVFDNVEQGLATVKPDGNIDAERSRVFDQWFGNASSTAFSDVLSKQTMPLQTWLQLAWEQLVDGFLPLDVALEQMPKQIEIGGRHYALGYKAITERDRFDGVLLVVSDITEEIEHKRHDAEQREGLAIIEHLMRDRSGFIEFFEECDALVTSVVGGTLEDVQVAMRAVHTIKGNAAMYGVTSVAHAAHQLETQIIDSKLLPNEADIAILSAAWRAVDERVRGLLGNEVEPMIEVTYDELDELIKAVTQRMPLAKLAELLERLKFERGSVRLRRVADQAKTLAQRLGKGTIQVEVRAESHVRFPSERWAAFWATFVHVVRNAVDHGIEPGPERLERGKAEQGTLVFAAACDERTLTIEVKDDGRGIRWERIRDKARALGLPHETHQDLLQAIFTDGVSTAESVTQVSGRGVGMAAMRDATRALNGTIVIESSEGTGTTLRFLFPALAIAKTGVLSGSVYQAVRDIALPLR
jgi:two-component system, chemotaxis family, sensor kinase CheA